MIANTFKVVKDLGSGASANVKLVEHFKTGERFACKIMKDSPEGKHEALLNEIVYNEVNTVGSLDHPFIYKILGAGRGEFTPSDSGKPFQVVFIIMEYAPNGELFDLIKSAKGFSEEIARYYFIQMLSTINYIHYKARICHRDIKPENIFVDEKYNLKFGDFGFATSIDGEDNSGYLHDYKGTLGYMPPEQHILHTYTGMANDLFATAVVLFIMVTQCLPFHKAVPEDLYYNLIINNHSKTFWKIFEKEVADLTPEFKDLIFKML